MSEPVTLDNNLQVYADHSVELMSPIKQESQNMHDEAEALDIKDAKSLKAGLELRKRVIKHINTTADYRKEYTRPLDAVTAQLIAGEREVLAPAEDAKTIVGKKVMEYEAEQERLAAIERDRIAKILESFDVNEAVYSKKVTVITDRGAKLKADFAALSQSDQDNADIKLAFTQAVNRLLEAKDILSRAQIDEAERAKNQAKRDAEELAARNEAETAPRTTAGPAPKTGVKMVTKFRIIDLEKVPRQYMTVNETAIRQAIATGVNNIPGVEVYKERSF